ncbi:IS3 family transposase [Silvanigrella paludirubra]|uniref:IS3 family transposase n=1 Tax=Silvanigrella paludirubra TaxID=2499159 RepID=A0A6N6W0C2_9BACT|nr:IS3 family transposase [Silvanigrella paludirubra]
MVVTFLQEKKQKSSVIEYIEVFYNRIRAHSALDYHAPLEYEENYEI